MISHASHEEYFKQDGQDKQDLERIYYNLCAFILHILLYPVKFFLCVLCGNIPPNT